MTKSAQTTTLFVHYSLQTGFIMSAVVILSLGSSYGRCHGIP